MKVKVINRSVYHKYAEIEVEVPNNIKEDDIMDWINDSDNWSEDDMDIAMSKTEYQFGSGVDDYDGMNETEMNSEWRFQCPNGYGGHL
tara:strand:+ start:1846 stop:2109 length:264 start_codon:yes stop_codon:yes gene_type:complete